MIKYRKATCADSWRWKLSCSKHVEDKLDIQRTVYRDVFL